MFDVRHWWPQHPEWVRTAPWWLFLICGWGQPTSWTPSWISVSKAEQSDGSLFWHETLLALKNVCGFTLGDRVPLRTCTYTHSLGCSSTRPISHFCSACIRSRQCRPFQNHNWRRVWRWDSRHVLWQTIRRRTRGNLNKSRTLEVQALSEKVL